MATNATVAQQGVDDLVLLGKGAINDKGVAANLEKRYNNQLIYTYIGPVLISVNPYKDLGTCKEDKVPVYHGHYPFENPPHIFALGEEAHRSMRSDQHNQCVLISGESGAGKTECAKLLMTYIAWVTGKSEKVTYVKDCVLQSNPFLEAFGNAKTLRNNNSSRFGKYFEIQFDQKGDPCGGMITNYLLEKSRIVYQQGGERNFHIFYNLTKGADQQEQQTFQLYGPDQFWFTCQGNAYDVDGINDTADYQEVRQAMTTVGLDQQQQYDLMYTVAGVLHIGNIQFAAGGKGHASVQDQGVLQLAASMIGVDPQLLAKAMTSRQIQTGGGGAGGGRGSRYNVPQNPEQAAGNRDALGRDMYSRQFDYIVALINAALQKYQAPFKNVIGILDIFGFEIFEHNGFEQFCINYVNEKLQQYFIELTLKAEQEEYVAEGIQWTPVKFFNNKIVCELVEGRPGMFGVLDDVCSTVHAESGDQADLKYLDKASGLFGSHAHFRAMNGAFQIKHYAGDVDYEVSGFTDKNKDTLFGDMVEAVQTSNNAYLVSLYPEVISSGQRKRPTTAGLKIKTSAQALMKTLSECNPHYIRCIKPNENKSANEWDTKRCEHQIKYLGLLENVRVRRAGFCFRAPFARFLKKYMYLSPKTWTAANGPFQGQPAEGCRMICQELQIDSDQWQVGKTKMFIRHPETLFFLEEELERKDYEMACAIQKVWKLWTMAKRAIEQRSRVAQLFKGKKERQRNSVGRQFSQDYINYDKQYDLGKIVRGFSDQETVMFADQVVSLNRRSAPERRDLVVTDQAVYLVARAKKQGQMFYKLTRRFAIADVQKVSLSELQDNWIILHVPKEYDCFFENDKKTEICACLLEASKKLTGRECDIQFSNSVTAKILSGDTRQFNFQKNESASAAQLKKAGKTITVGIASGMDRNTDSTPQVNTMAMASPGGGAARAPRGGGGAPRGGGGAPRGGGGAPRGGGGAPRGGGGRGGPKGGRGGPRGGRGGRGGGPPPAAQKTCTAQYDYAGTAADELTFSAGDVITIVSKDGDWWKGSLNGKTGFMPANYVQEN